LGDARGQWGIHEPFQPQLFAVLARRSPARTSNNEKERNMKMRIAMVAAFVLVIGMMAGPAFAATADSGVFAGTASVGKVKTGACDANNFTPSLSGGGLGLPSLATNGKTGWFTLSAPSPVDLDANGTPEHAGAFQTVANGAGALNACGQLGPVLGLVGAACGVSTGHSGFGRAAAGAFSVKLTNVGWPTSAGGTLPVVADAQNGTETGKAVALVQAQGGAACLGKSGNATSKSGGATGFTVVGVFAAATA
jgi:hypothetical protein